MPYGNTECVSANPNVETYVAIDAAPANGTVEPAPAAHSKITTRASLRTPRRTIASSIAPPTDVGGHRTEALGLCKESHPGARTAPSADQVTPGTASGVATHVTE